MRMRPRALRSTSIAPERSAAYSSAASPMSEAVEIGVVIRISPNLLHSRIRSIQQIDRMHGPSANSGAQHASADLHLTTWIPRGDEVGFRCLDVRELGLEYARRYLGLEQVVDAGGAATLVGVGQWHYP